MQFTRGLALLTVATTAMAIACSDAGPSEPDLGRASLGTTGTTGTDTAKAPGGSTPTTPTAPKPDSATTTPTPTPTQPSGSTDPRVLSGVVHGMGPMPDSSKYELVANATIVLTLPDDSTSGTAGKEVARVTSKADGSFSLGSFKPGVYQISVTPPADSPFRATHWGFVVTQYSAATMDLGIWLQRQ